jgi:DMSO/TMAO reductase YedYZ molybdopterin-dependent catalytic subunit
MGNARWTGVRLKDVLDRAGVKAGAIQVRFDGMDEPVVADAPDFMKSLDIDHARDGEVMLAYAMNGEQLPLLNGFPLRLIVPGWYSTYWVKMLYDIEVLDRIRITGRRRPTRSRTRRARTSDRVRLTSSSCRSAEWCRDPSSRTSRRVTR